MNIDYRTQLINRLIGWRNLISWLQLHVVQQENYFMFDLYKCHACCDWKFNAYLDLEYDCYIRPLIPDENPNEAVNFTWNSHENLLNRAVQHMHLFMTKFA